MDQTRSRNISQFHPVTFTHQGDQYSGYCAKVSFNPEVKYATTDSEFKNIANAVPTIMLSEDEYAATVATSCSNDENIIIVSSGATTLVNQSISFAN